MSNKINKEWHMAHKMPFKADEVTRVAWHYQHALHCGCRKPPYKMVFLMEQYGYDVKKITSAQDPKATTN